MIHSCKASSKSTNPNFVAKRILREEPAVKHRIFGILQRGGKVYTEIAPDCAKMTLQAIIRGKVDAESIAHSEYWRGYSGLVAMGYKKHSRIHHSETW
jgi:transposase-like protein